MGGRKGKKKSINNPELEQTMESMINAFNQKIDQLNFSKAPSASTSSTIHEVIQKTTKDNNSVEERENALKEKEIEILKRENELMKSAIEQTRTQNCSFTFKDVEESLLKFSGDDNVKVERWITEFEEMADTVGWNQIQRLVYAKRLLTGTAKHSCSSTGGSQTWEQLKNYLKAEFKMNL